MGTAPAAFHWGCSSGPPSMALGQWLRLCTRHSIHASTGPEICMPLHHSLSHTCKTIQMHKQHRSDTESSAMGSLNTLCTLGIFLPPPKESFQSLYTVAFSMFFFSFCFLKHDLRLLLKHRNTEQLKTSTNFAFPSDLFTASSKNLLAHFGCLKRKEKK